MRVNQAIAEATVNAVTRTSTVRRVIVVTDSVTWTEHLLARVVLQRREGLHGAILDGLEQAEPGNTAILTGDLPALRTADLAEALQLAAETPLGMVADRHGTGTVLLTALDRCRHTPRFGEHSADAHSRLGYQHLPLRDDTSLRLDVDTLQDLQDAMELGTPPIVQATVAATMQALRPLERSQT
jgi:2-phospho-L-lactate guanylyltransferase